MQMWKWCSCEFHWFCHIENVKKLRASKLNAPITAALNRKNLVFKKSLNLQFDEQSFITEHFIHLYFSRPMTIHSHSWARNLMANNVYFVIKTMRKRMKKCFKVGELTIRTSKCFKQTKKLTEWVEHSSG